MINEQRLESIFCKTQEQLHEYLVKELKSLGYTVQQRKPDFIYAEGNFPVMLVAHLDTVHRNQAKFVCKSNNGIWMSPDGIGGDDRCGVELILSILDTGRRPHILFTHEEEVGGLGAYEFVKEGIRPELNYIVEFDRMDSNDAVFYDCDNHDFVEFVERFGFEENYGSFSDISVIAPELGVAAVNLSSGYHNAHTCHEWISIPEMNSIFEKSLKLLDDHETRFVYIERISKHKYGGEYGVTAPYSFDSYSKYKDWYSAWDDIDYYKGTAKAEDKKDGGKLEDEEVICEEDWGECETELMEIPDESYIIFDDCYFDSTEGYYFIDPNGAVYEWDEEALFNLKGAQAFDAYGNDLRFNDACSFKYIGEIYVVKSAA